MFSRVTFTIDSTADSKALLQFQTKRQDPNNFLTPSLLDTERYNWYLENGIDPHCIPDIPKANLDNIRVKSGSNIDPSSSEITFLNRC